MIHLRTLSEGDIHGNIQVKCNLETLEYVKFNHARVEMKPSRASKYGAKCWAHMVLFNPPTPVERVDGSPQLGLPSDLLSKPKAFGAAIFWAWCAGCPKPCNFPVFLSLAC